MLRAEGAAWTIGCRRMILSAQEDTKHLVDSPRRSSRDRLVEVLLAGGLRWSSEDAQDLSQTARAIVFAPHPDDEVLGCGGMIALKAIAGADVQVVVMTDGRTSHARFVEAPTLIQMRRLEALEAGEHLGLNPSAYTFLDFEDQRLHQHAEQAHQRVVEMLQRFNPQQVFVPHRRDRLADHEATFRIVVAALRTYKGRVTVLEYPVWLWNTWPWTGGWRRDDPRLVRVQRLLRDGFELAFGCSTRVDIRSVLQQKVDALHAYRSQMQRPQDTPHWPILSDVSDGAFLARFLTGWEVFRRTTY
jgi:LmbE family N-acetylglucosaminyl deacetylase